MLTKKNGNVNLPHNFRAEILDDTLVIKSQNSCEQIHQAAVDIDGITEFSDKILETKILNASRYDLKNFINTKDKNIEWFDFDKIQGDLIIRTRKTGDKFIPIGRKHPRKISDITADKDVLVLTDKKNILWLIGQKPSEHAKITPSTKNILQIKCQPRQ